MTKFCDYELRIIKPSFSSYLTDSIINLEHLRKRRLEGTTHPGIFFQLKNVFHLLESIGSARIEGNNTTIAEYIETKIDPSIRDDEDIQEIANMEKAMTFIEEILDDDVAIDRAFVFELHKLTVNNLSREGDQTPGQFRKGNVQISGSNHIPPDALHVNDYMDELFCFINKREEPKYDLLKTALAHHRFCWIHPFNNGNGRSVRLLTYAMLIKQGFKVNTGRILNPTAVFCSDRDKYYEMLSEGDKGTDEGLLNWCTYVLNGLNIEISKVDKLCDHDYLANKILLPALVVCRAREYITKLEFELLKIAIDKIVFQSSDIESVMPGKIPSERSRVLAKLKDDKLIAPIKEGGRKYVINFSNNYLLRGVIDALQKEGFISLRE
ncbi:MAG: Fic family protein [Methylococcaceae bacterium]|nr:Fic family protein [Methylococcaceae bacterium]